MRVKSSASFCTTSGIKPLEKSIVTIWKMCITLSLWLWPTLLINCGVNTVGYVLLGHVAIHKGFTCPM